MMNQCWTMDAIVVTIAYTSLLAWGFGVGLAQVWQGLRRPDALLNPLFRNKYAQWLFALHLLTLDAHALITLQVAGAGLNSAAAPGTRA